MQEVQDSSMLYRSSDCIFSRRLEKTSFPHLDGKYSDFDEKYSHLDGRFSDFVTQKGHCFYVTQIARISQIFFRTRIARKRRGYEPFSLSLAAIVSPMREVHRRLGGEKQGEIITQTWLCHTDITDVTDIFSNTNRTKKLKILLFSSLLWTRFVRGSVP